MTSRDALVRRMLDDPAITALVGNRIKPEWMPQGMADPYVTVTTISRVRQSNLDGPAGLVKTRNQVDVFASSLRAAERIAELVRLRLDGFTGTVTSGSESLQIDLCTLDTEDEDFDRYEEPADTGLRRVSMDFITANPEAAV